MEKCEEEKNEVEPILPLKKYSLLTLKMYKKHFLEVMCSRHFPVGGLASTSEFRVQSSERRCSVWVCGVIVRWR
jgi:hypothetical protein